MKTILLVLAAFFSVSFARAENFKKVLVIVFENSTYTSALKQPFFSALTKEGALLTNFKASTHPSQGNYLSMIGGSTFNVNHDKLIDLNETHLGDLLEEAKKDWKVYAEDYPGGCFLDMQSNNYVRKHVPFLSFTNVSKNPARCSKIVEGQDFYKDFAAGKLADFSLYIPNLKNDGHDTGIAYGDKWFKENFDKVLHSPLLPKDLLVVVTFDEGALLNNQIYTLLFGANVSAGASSAKPNNFYTLLKTYEDELGLGSLNRMDLSAQKIDDIWIK